MKQLLFLCTGNYYRSRFAEYFFNHFAVQQQLQWQADSRGLALERGVNNIGEMSPYTVKGLETYGISCPSPLRYPLAATENDFTQADKIIAVDESEHYPLMSSRFPQWVDQVEYWQVHDIDRTDPTAALGQLEHHLRQLLNLLAVDG